MIKPAFLTSFHHVSDSQAVKPALVFNKVLVENKSCEKCGLKSSKRSNAVCYYSHSTGTHPNDP
jgi:hypothetical protein